MIKTTKWFKWLQGSKWFNEDDGILERLKTVTSILSVVFAIFVFFHTVYPVFEKEKLLADSKVKIIELNNDISNKTQQVKNLQLEISSYNEKVQKLTSNITD